MSKAFRKVTDTPEEAEVITVEWATRTATDYLEQMLTYMESCAKSTDAVERIKYYESSVDALSHICIANQMIGALTDEKILTEHIFGEFPVEIVEWNPDIQEEKEKEE